MYSIEKELKILRQFVKPEHMDTSEGWHCYSEDEVSAAEERLHTKLPPPIREIYLYMADLLIGSKHNFPDEPSCYFCEVFAGHTAEYFQDLDHRIRKEFVPLSAHLELLEMEVPMQTAYARQNPDALLISQDILLILLTKTPPEQAFLENIRELTGLPLCAGL